MSDSDFRERLQTHLGSGYTIERELGGGGMSRVFVARDETLGRLVVVKVLPPDTAAGVSADRFKREIQLAARLQHPHIVPLLSSGESDGLPFFTMPFVEGESLRVRLARGGELPVAEAVRVLREIASALAYAHERGIVHRDIKPDNVLLSHGAAMVTDFGVAKALSSSSNGDHAGMTSLGVALGTPAYMSPEQASADPAVDHRADIYAFGILAYELLTGQTPFGGRAPQGLLAAHVSEPAEPIEKRRPSLPPTLAALVMRCLEKRPADRPQTASEIVHALDDLTTPSGGTQPTANRPAAALEGPEVTRRRTMTLGGASALAAIGIAAAVWLTHRAPASKSVAAAGPTMLAVLPFDNDGPKEQAVFTDGLTDAVTAKLSALSGLAVIDPRSASQYGHSAKPARQIGTELGVRYLLEGVVRWAKGADATWRAQVRPTLVDATTGTTTWTGDPVVVTPSDPFTAQASIASGVATALAVVLRPSDKEQLSKPLTTNADAFAAYQRGVSFDEAASRSGQASPYDAERAANELARAVELDSTFGAAWGRLAWVRGWLASLRPGDKAAESSMRAAMSQALAHAPNEPRVVLADAIQRFNFDHDAASAETLVRRALALAPNEPFVVAFAGRYLMGSAGQPDSGYALLKRAAALNPRDPSLAEFVATYALATRRWSDVDRYLAAAIELDSLRESPWMLRVQRSEYQGDTLGMQRELAAALAVIPHPSNTLLNTMAYAGMAYARRYVALSARDLGVATLADSVYAYYDNKADAYARLGDGPHERIYYDSIRTKLAGRTFSGSRESLLLEELALASAATGHPAEARQALARARAVVRLTSKNGDPSSQLDPEVLAAIFGWLAEPDSAVPVLEAALANPIGYRTARGIAIHPKLHVLHGTPAFERFLRAHPE